MIRSQKTLVACATKQANFAEQIAEAAHYIGEEFTAAEHLTSVLGRCHSRLSTCIVVDYETAFETPLTFQTRKALRDLPVLVAVPPRDMQAAFQAASAGATGVFEDDAPHVEIAACLSAAIMSDTESRKTGRYSHPVYSQLKEREKQILFHLMAGEPNKRVASILDIGLRTVEAGRAEVMMKLGVSSFAQLITFVTEVEHDRHIFRRSVYERILDRTESEIRM